MLSCVYEELDPQVLLQLLASVCVSIYVFVSMAI